MRPAEGVDDEAFLRPLAHRLFQHLQRLVQMLAPLDPGVGEIVEHVRLVGRELQRLLEILLRRRPLLGALVRRCRGSRTAASLPARACPAGRSRRHRPSPPLRTSCWSAAAGPAAGRRRCRSCPRPSACAAWLRPRRTSPAGDRIPRSRAARAGGRSRSPAPGCRRRSPGRDDWPGDAGRRAPAPRCRAWDRGRARDASATSHRRYSRPPSAPWRPGCRRSRGPASGP